MKSQSFHTTALAPSKLIIHNDSHTISKQKPKIRIIHIVAPQIIKTDVENFRELVQKLTGYKPSADRRGNMKNKKKNNVSSQAKTYASTHTISTYSERMKKESDEETHTNNSFMSTFIADVDGFMHNMNEFTLLPFRSSQINTFGDQIQMPLR